MVGEQIQYASQEPVVVVANQAQAQLLLATLRVHDIEAHAVAASAFPSLDWAQGVAVTVAAAERALAIELLRELGHEPLGD